MRAPRGQPVPHARMTARPAPRPDDPPVEVGGLVEPLGELEEQLVHLLGFGQRHRHVGDRGPELGIGGGQPDIDQVRRQRFAGPQHFPGLGAAPTNTDDAIVTIGDKVITNYLHGVTQVPVGPQAALVSSPTGSSISDAGRSAQPTVRSRIGAKA